LLPTRHWVLKIFEVFAANQTRDFGDFQDLVKFHPKNLSKGCYLNDFFNKYIQVKTGIMNLTYNICRCTQLKIAVVRVVNNPGIMNKYIRSKMKYSIYYWLSYK